jgi:error-prone DNA polymerase
MAVRMGLRYVKGLSAADQGAIVRFRGQRPADDLADLVYRGGLSEKAMVALAEAGALECFGASRRETLWQVRGLLRDRQGSLPLVRRERLPSLPTLDDFDTIAWDYRTSQHSPRGHPLSTLRASLRAMNLPDAAAVSAMRDGQRTRYVGVVICRQRPATARGVTFMTLEDETGFVNLVIWQQVFERYAALARTANLLGITGTIQSQQGVVHLVAQSLWQPELSKSPPTHKSRNFR